MIKKISSVLITLSLSLSLAVTSFAEDNIQTAAVQNDEGAAQTLFVLNIAQQPEQGTVYDAQTISRAQYTDMLL